MKHTGSVYMRRLRVRLDRHEASVIGTALIGGTMVPAPSDWSRQAQLLSRNINQHWTRTNYAPFPPITPSDDAVQSVDDVGALLSGDSPFYADYFAFHYAGVVHASVCLRSNATGQDTLALRSSVGTESLWTSTRSGGFSPRPSMLANPISDAELTSTLLDPDTTPPGRPIPITPSRLARVFDVDTLSGPALTDPVWLMPFPNEGTDIAFDADHTDGVSARYRLSSPDLLK